MWVLHVASHGPRSLGCLSGTRDQAPCTARFQITPLSFCHGTSTLGPEGCGSCVGQTVPALEGLIMENGYDVMFIFLGEPIVFTRLY